VKQTMPRTKETKEVTAMIHETLKGLFNFSLLFIIIFSIYLKEDAFWL
jgi:hypothetical protein